MSTLTLYTDIKGQNINTPHAFGQTTLVYSPENGQGKTSLLNGLSLVLWGWADDVRGKDGVKDSSKLISLAADGGDSLEAVLEIHSDDSYSGQFSYSLQRGKDPRWNPPTKRLEAVHVLVKELMSGDQTQMRKRLCQMVGAEGDSAMLAQRYLVEFTKLSIPKGDRITRLEALRDAADQKMRASNKKYKDVDAEIKRLNGELSKVPLVDAAELARLETAEKEMQAAQSVAVNHTAPSHSTSMSTIETCEACGSVLSSGSAVPYPTSIYAGASPVRPDFRRLVELQSAAARKKELEFSLKQKRTVEKPQAEADATHYQAVKKAAAEAMLEEVVSVREAALATIQKYLPSKYMVNMDDDGLISLSCGDVPSGAEWAILQVAIGAALCPDGGVFILPDRSWGPRTLYSALEIFTTMPIMVIVQSTTLPINSNDRDGVSRCPSGVNLIDRSPDPIFNEHESNTYGGF